MRSANLSDSIREFNVADQDAEALHRETAWRSQGPRLWFLLPDRLGRWRPWLAGGAVAGLVLLLFGSLTLVLHGTEEAWPMLSDPKLAATASFFLASLGLLAGLAQIVFPAARRDLDDLRGISMAPAATLDAMSKALARLPRRSALMALPIAIALAAAHLWLLGPNSPHFGPEFASSVCTVLLWVAMFQISIPLVHNARLFSLLGRCSEVDLYGPGQLTPFGRTAIRPCLFIIALQCAYVLLLLPEDNRFAAGTAIGLMASMALVAMLFFLPLRGIRSRISSCRSETIASLDDRLARLPQPGQGAADNNSLSEAATLLVLRERIERVSNWPVGLEGVRRLFFYLVLVPLTWVGAALVEMLLDARF